MNGGPLIMHFNVCFSKRVSNVKESAFNDLWNWALAFLTFKSFWLLFSKGNINIMGPKDFMHTDLPKLGISNLSGKMAPAGGWGSTRSNVLDSFQFCARIPQKVIWQTLTAVHPIATQCFLSLQQIMATRQHSDQWKIRRSLSEGLWKEGFCFLGKRKSWR